MRLLFVKEGAAIWSSHLDLMRALMRSFRRAGIDLKHSQGFTPHPELSILMPLSVGVESQCEIAEFTLAEGCAIPAEEIAPRLAPVLPAGIRALESWDGGLKAGKLAWLRARLSLSYGVGAVIGRPPKADGSEMQNAKCKMQNEASGDEGERILRSAQNDRIEALQQLFARPSIVVEKHGKKGPSEVDIAPMIRELNVGTSIACPPSAIVLEAVVAAQNPTLNPLLLATAIETYLPEYKPDLVQCRRLEIFDSDFHPFR